MQSASKKKMPGTIMDHDTMNRSLHTKPLRRKPLILAACILLALWAIMPAARAEAVRLKDLASVKGVRDNQLVGYGLVVGLNGTGDGNNAAFTSKGLASVLKNMGVKIDPDTLKVKNVASVMITAKLPPFVKVGQNIDVTLSSVGDASSLQGGTLLATPLKGLDNKIYAMAQGPISIGGFEVDGATTGRQKNHLTVARIPNGASVEQEVPVSFADRERITLTLESPDFTTVSRLVEAVDKFLGGSFAQASDGATVEIAIPEKYGQQGVTFLAAIENLEITPDSTAKVVLDERTGTIVMGEGVRIRQLALSHGTLSLQVKAAKPRSPTKEELLESPATEDLLLGREPVTAGAAGQRLIKVEEGTTLGEVVRALNSVGVAPRDLIAIFQSIKASGALQADLEII